MKGTVRTEGRRALRLGRAILANVCLVCGLVWITAAVLDWYNPYMDFSGHVFPLKALLCLAAILLAADAVFFKLIRRRKRQDSCK